MIFCLVYPFKKYSTDIEKLKARLSELIPLDNYKKSQEGQEQEWLRLGIDEIDFNYRDYYAEKDIFVKFHIDSGLVYNFKPYRMWVTPVIGGYEPAESQYEIKQTPNFPRGKRWQDPSSWAIFINDTKLWGLINEAKQDSLIKRGLKIEMELRSGESKQVFKADLN